MRRGKGYCPTASAPSAAELLEYTAYRTPACLGGSASEAYTCAIVIQPAGCMRTARHFQLFSTARAPSAAALLEYTSQRAPIYLEGSASEAYTRATIHQLAGYMRMIRYLQPFTTGIALSVANLVEHTSYCAPACSRGSNLGRTLVLQYSSPLVVCASLKVPSCPLQRAFPERLRTHVHI
jgi:hypothetical protein